MLSCCDVISGARFAILKGYLRGQVCFFYKHHLSKNAINIVVSALF